MNTQPSSIELNATDRCDRCGAQAYSVYNYGVLELMFCKHHIEQYNEALENAGWTVLYDYVGLEHLLETEDAVHA